jgi:hypothetical protein
VGICPSLKQQNHSNLCEADSLCLKSSFNNFISSHFLKFCAEFDTCYFVLESQIQYTMQVLLFTCDYCARLNGFGDVLLVDKQQNIQTC